MSTITTLPQLTKQITRQTDRAIFVSHGVTPMYTVLNHLIDVAKQNGNVQVILPPHYTYDDEWFEQHFDNINEPTTVILTELRTDTMNQTYAITKRALQNPHIRLIFDITSSDLVHSNLLKSCCDQCNVTGPQLQIPNAI